MAVIVKCPGCHTAYRAPDHRLGTEVSCRVCRQKFTLAISRDETGVPPAPPPRSDSDRAQPRAADSLGNRGPSAAPLSVWADPGVPSLAPAGPSDGDAAPATIGRYVVVRWLGGGAMGQVWLAWDPTLQREVAIKTLRPEVALSAQGLDRFLREARSAAKLHHTNAVTIYQVGVDGQTAYIAMEYVEGQSLDRAVSSVRPMGWREATRAVRDAAAGLAAAHKLGLIHRDVKPANLMRTSDGVTKVVDFGLARAQTGQTQLTQQGALLGTPSYMAPELWRRQQADARSDLYSLTCTYYYLLTGRAPFDAPLPALGYLHRHEPWPDPRPCVPDLPDAVCHILARGSQKDPAARYQAAAELIAALDAVLTAGPGAWTASCSWTQLVAAPDTAGAPGLSAAHLGDALVRAGPRIRPRRRGPLVSALAAGVVAVLVLFGAVIYVATGGFPASRRPPSPPVAAKDTTTVATPSGPVEDSPAVRLSKVKQNLTQISRAMHIYQFSYSRKTFPPAASRDESGQPLLSWRVTLLPFLDQATLYHHFHLNEPWDSPHNKALIPYMPPVYCNPARPNDGMTTVMVFVGPRSPFGEVRRPNDDGCLPADIVDGMGNTIMVVDAGTDKAVPWTKPEDLPFRPEDPWSTLGNLPAYGLAAVFFDGSTHTIPRDTGAETLRALITHHAWDKILWQGLE